ncbi:hypothetical protein T265_06270 [Opisthorchis viverrini]|uniref:Uncharacterized protein n=1 Tax=Opisthorchis viverrini TaxID=6198 RepID=A0A075AE37_OPIVI|nr:hypothetical protein T265_06270 [Opisthorchis viverrini]KER26479.1 hypothetical protein T265_06270 [Opisthorchis viverrini]
MDSPDSLHEDFDALNDETFDCAEAGDWELEHEQFALKESASENLAPEADALPRFWEAPGDFSFLWQPNALETFENVFEDEGRERGVDVEETIQKLVSEDETFDDPAILDISRKVCRQKSYGSALEKILDVPSYPPAHTNILGTCKDIWSSDEASAPMGATVRKREQATSSRDSLSLMDILRRLGSSASPSNEKHSEDTSLPGSTNLLPKLLREGNIHRQSFPVPETRVKSEAVGAKYSKKPVSVSCALPIPLDTVGSMNSRSLTDRRGPPFMRHPIHPDRPPLAVTPLNFPARLQPPVSCAVMPSVADNFGVRPLLLGTYSGLQNDLGASALHFLLLNAQNRTANMVRDPRILQLFPPPITPGMRVPLLPSPAMRFAGGGTQTHPTLVRQTSHPPLQFCVPPPPPPPSGLHYAPAVRSVVRPANPMWVQYVKADETMGADADSNEPFDPNVGSWMTRFESIGVLLMHLRPLIVSNPYVQDYYFAVRWLRQATAERSRQPRNGPPLPGQLPPIMHMPSPLSPENLTDSDHFHFSSLKRRFVVPLALVPALRHSQSPDNTPANEDPAASMKREASPSSSLVSQPSANVAAAVDTSSSLGRMTRSNVHCPRVVVELSLASALSSGSCESELVSENSTENPATSMTEQTASTTSRDFGYHPTVHVKFARKRRLLLARIEWMYSLILHIDEVDISLIRIVVQNEMRNRLTSHRQQLLNQLLGDLFRSSAYPTGKPPAMAPTSEITDSHSPWLDMLAIRKGIRLIASVLHHLPPLFSNRCLQEFLVHFHKAHTLLSPFMKECTSLLYPSLRHAVYQTTDVESLMRVCFPEVIEPLGRHPEPSERIKALLTSQLGLSLVFCLLDMCARLSKPEDPSSFIRAAAFFAYMATSPSLADSDSPRPIESFPHLASIIPVYVRPEDHPPLSSERLERFCQLACVPHSDNRNAGSASVRAPTLHAAQDTKPKDTTETSSHLQVDSKPPIMNGVLSQNIAVSLSSLNLTKSNDGGPASSPTPVAAM